MKPTPRPFYATNARDLLETRRQGLVPQGPVNVAMDGGDFGGETALYLRADMPLDRMDWRMLVNLEVCIWASPSVPLERVIDTALRIAHVKPSRLVLAFDDGQTIHEVDVGMGFHHNGIPGHIPPDHSFLWMPMRLCMTKIGKQLAAALNTKHRMWSYV